MALKLLIKARQPFPADQRVTRTATETAPAELLYACLIREDTNLEKISGNSSVAVSANNASVTGVNGKSVHKSIKMGISDKNKKNAALDAKALIFC